MNSELGSRPKPTDREPPIVTVGLPTFNREWSLPKVLASLLAFDYPKKRLRICFVDNESTDRTMEIIGEFIRAHGSEYESVVVKSARSNIPVARNTVFECAKETDYVFFLDSDITAPPDTVNRLLGPFQRDPKVGMVALPWDNRNARRRAGFFFRAFKVPWGPHEAYKVGSGCNMVSMAAFSAVGGYNPKLTVHEDSGFSFDIRKGGFKIVSDSSSEGTHLREIEVNPIFYLRFMQDSAVTYRELLARGSPLHIAKVISSYILLASLLGLVIFWSLSASVLFLGGLAFCVWLNGSAMAMDDGAQVRLPYRPVIGAIFTVTTTIISLLLLWLLVRKRYERVRPVDVPTGGVIGPTTSGKP